jgi:DNA-binding SARP family transcriptional activator
VEFRILGPVEVMAQGRPLPIGGARQRALLALLLTRANEIVSFDRIIDELWGPEPPEGAASALQQRVSQLRKAIAPSDAIVTRGGGYSIRVTPDEFDLLRFERLVEEAQRTAPEVAAARLGEALGLWRGAPLADLADAPFAQAESARLEELRLSALELRFDADLALGGHAGLVAELEAATRAHPLRERLRALLMRALYATGRQAEALEVFRETRAFLMEQLGIEPSPALQELERSILRQDPALAAPERSPVAQRAIVVVVDDPNRLADLLAVAEPLARQPERELILARLLASGGDLAAENATLADARRTLGESGVPARVAVFTSTDPGDDAVALVGEHDVDLLVVDASPSLLEQGRPDPALLAILERAPCDVGVLAGRAVGRSGPVVTAFGGVEHDWSAIEIAAWLASTLDATLRLVGTEAEPERGRRDASRLLARASMLVQQVVGIVTEPVLVPAGERGVRDAARDARLLVVGLSDRWRAEGLGAARMAITDAAPTLFVRRGLRPSGIAPRETLTRFTWSLGSG